VLNLNPSESMIGADNVPNEINPRIDGGKREAALAVDLTWILGDHSLLFALKESKTAMLPQELVDIIIDHLHDNLPALYNCPFLAGEQQNPQIRDRRLRFRCIRQP
jgi:hypothetical protein